MDEIRSAPAPFESGPVVEEQLSGGATASYSWTGTRDEMVIKRAQVRASRPSTIRLEPDTAGHWRLTATFAGGAFGDGEGGNIEIPVNSHELEVSMEQASIYNSPVLFENMISGSTEDRANKILGATQRIAAKYNAGGFEPATGSAHTSLTNAAAALAVEVLKIEPLKVSLAQRLLIAVCGRGMDSFLQFNTVYRRSITAASWFQVRAAYIGVGEIWTGAEVEAFEGIPTGEWFGLDPWSQYLKTPPNVGAAAGGRTTISYSYIGSKRASSLVYRAFGGAVLLD